MAGAPVITCPECHKKFKGKGDLKGKKVRCPFCKEAFAVNDEDEEQAAEPAAPEPAAAPAGGHEDVDINPYGATDQDLRARCPNCANEMEDENATICLFCGYNTLTRVWGKTVKLVAHTPGQIFLHLLPAIGAFLWIVMVLCGVLYFCLVLPSQVGGGYLAFLDHESLRMWLAIICMGVLWGAGMFCYQRFFIDPLPPEIQKE